MMFSSNIFCVNKPLDWTSNDVVCFIKKKYGFKKVGHAGTLDPNATGVLVIGVNEGTKELGKLTLHNKTYKAEILLGIETDSYDLKGKIVNQIDVPNLTLNEIDQTIQNNFMNNYEQLPPIYSAIKVKGKKLYEYARKGEQVKIEPRNVKINSYKLLSYKNNIISIEMNVSKGFYIRSFAHDLGKALNTYGVLKSLCRTSSGEFTLADCINVF